MTVYKRRNKWIIDVTVEMPDGSTKRARKTSPVQTRRDAEAYERELRRKILSGEYGRDAEAETPAPTVGSLAHEYIAYMSVDRRPSTIKVYKTNLRVHVLPRFGAREASSITTADVMTWVSDLSAGGLGNSTIRGILYALRGVLTHAMNAGHIDGVIKFPVPRPPPGRLRWLSTIEAAQLIDELAPSRAKSPRWQCGARMVLGTGLRIGELLALQWDDLDLNAGTAVVSRSMVSHLGTPGPTKSGKTRTVPLGGSSAAALITLHDDAEGPYIWHGDGGAPVRHITAQQAIARAVKKAKMSDVSWHTLRHTYAAWLAQAGVTMRVLRDLLGHADIATTMRYAHLSPESHQSAADLLPDV